MRIALFQILPFIKRYLYVIYAVKGASHSSTDLCGDDSRAYARVVDEFKMLICLASRL